MNLLNAMWWAVKNKNVINQAEVPLKNIEAANAGLKAHNYGSTEFFGKCCVQIIALLAILAPVVPLPYKAYLALGIAVFEMVYMIGRLGHKWGQDDTTPIQAPDINGLLDKIAAVLPAQAPAPADANANVSVTVQK